MKKYLLFTISIAMFVMIGCSDDPVSVSTKEYLTSTTWQLDAMIVETGIISVDIMDTSFLGEIPQVFLSLYSDGNYVIDSDSEVFAEYSGFSSASGDWSLNEGNETVLVLTGMQDSEMSLTIKDLDYTKLKGSTTFDSDSITYGGMTFYIGDYSPVINFEFIPKK